ncbi:MAG TPA: hypothetical protein VJM33_07730 [Microthrixaceae bacterium]|nr:hypothetical protein [Microthrixaceae bacterium]
MSNWKSEFDKLVEAAWRDNNESPEDAVARLLPDYLHQIQLDEERKALDRFNVKRKKDWAEPDDKFDALRFDLGGEEFTINDAPVRWVDDDNEVRYKPARYSTGTERLDSLSSRVQHHASWVRRSEAEHSREREQIHAAALAGVDLENTPFDKARHLALDTRCWNCGGDYRDGDPFERGHSDKAASQGGSQVEWEHQSCNRSHKANIR